jgi:hypothetical protein
MKGLGGKNRSKRFWEEYNFTFFLYFYKNFKLNLIHICCSIFTALKPNSTKIKK